jgi:hypothetical protein
VGVALALGCVATAPDRPARIYVSGPPPAPLAEVPSGAGGAEAVWVEGYWHWNGVQYVWIPGHWESPAPGYVWVAPRYVLLDGRYVYHPGGWRMRTRARVQAR